MEIGSKNQEFKKSKVVVNHTCFTTHTRMVLSSVYEKQAGCGQGCQK